MQVHGGQDNHIMDMEGTLHPIQALSIIVKCSYKIEKV